MDIKTITFGNLTQAAYDTALGYLKRAGSRIALEFETAVIFGVAAVFKTGDATHINRVLPALKLAKLEPMYRRTVVAFDIVPFHYDKGECQHVGKINVGRRAALQIVDDKGVPQWEGLLRAALDGEKPENKTPREFNLDARFDSLLKAARKAGSTDAEITAAYRAAKRKHPADSTMMSPQDQERVADNAKKHAEKVKVATTKSRKAA